MTVFKNYFSIIIMVIATGCAGAKPLFYSKATSNTDPVKFFIDATHSTGVLENAAGKPTAEVKTNTRGEAVRDSILIEQDLYQDGKKTHRSWKLNRLDEHHIDGTANNIEGVAHGLLNGNTFAWTFRFKLPERKFINHVRMTQYMYTMPGGQTMLIRSIIKKFGFKVAQITEEFVRG